MIKADAELLNNFGVPAFALEVGASDLPVYTACNRDWYARTRLQPRDVIGRSAEEVHEGRLGHEEHKRHMQVLGCKQRTTYDLPLPVGGRTIGLRTTLTPVLDGAGQIQQIIGVMIDKTAEFEAEVAQAEAETLSSEIEEFIALAAHDLRAPMRNIRALADMLRDGFHDMGDGKLELIDMLEEVAIKSTSLITDILAHSQAVTAPRRLETFDMRQLCLDIMVILDPLNRHRMHASEIYVEGDKVAIQIVLRNLLDNAIKHCGSDRVALSVEVGPAANGMLAFDVRDNGAGFADTSIAFLDGGRLRTDSGYGLLGIRRLVKARGGTISAENTSDESGSIVRITLPGRVAAAPA